MSITEIPGFRLLQEADNQPGLRRDVVVFNIAVWLQGQRETGAGDMVNMENMTSKHWVNK